MDRILKAVRVIKQKGLYPNMPVVNSPHRPEIVVNGKKVLLFASNNYLGMTTDPRVIAAAKVGLEKWGIGNGSSRLLTGNLEIHEELERSVAGFKNKEAALSFVTGYMVNSGCIPAIVNVLDVSLLRSLNLKKSKPDTVVFSDEYNHASIVAGIKLSGAEKEIYRHNDMKDLEERLAKYSKKTRKLILTDGVFSMDGDIVDLPMLVGLAKEYGAMIYLDDAHGMGIIGPNGRGTEDYFNLEGTADFVMGTFTKSFGGVGGYISGSQELIDYLKISTKSYIFTAPIAPPVVCGLIESIKIVKQETWRREKLLSNAQYLRTNLNQLGYDTCKSETQIIPVMIGDEMKAMEISRKLFEYGIFVQEARWPAVPKGTARLRFAVMATHEQKQIDKLLDIMARVKKDFKV
jgi:8-amino-7-oxononanoate synthase